MSEPRPARPIVAVAVVVAAAATAWMAAAPSPGQSDDPPAATAKQKAGPGSSNKTAADATAEPGAGTEAKPEVPKPLLAEERPYRVLLSMAIRSDSLFPGRFRTQLAGEIATVVDRTWGRMLAFQQRRNDWLFPATASGLERLESAALTDRFELERHSSSVLGVAFSSDGARLVTAGSDRTAKVWATSTGRVLLTLTGHTDDVTSAVFSPNGRWLASASSDDTARVWDASTGRELLTLTGHADDVWSVSFSPDGQRLATASNDKTLKVWDASTGRELLTLEGHSGPVTSVSFSPDGQRLASASHDETVKAWDASTGEVLLTLKGHKGSVAGVSFSPDGRRLASASHDETVKVWDASTGEVSLTLEGHGLPVNGVAFSPDGEHLASANWDGTVKVWDLSTGQVSLTLEGHNGTVTSVSFSRDGQQLVSASHDRSVKVWDASTGGELLTLSGWDKVFVVTVARTGRRFDVAAREWDRATGRAGLTVTRRVFDRRLLAVEVTRIVRDLFRPVAMIEVGTPTSARIRLRAGEFPAADPDAAQLSPGDHLEPLLHYRDRKTGSVLRTQFLPWTFLEVSSRERALLDCTVATAMRNPLRGGGRRVDMLAAGLKTLLPATRIALTARGTPPRPLIGHRVVATSTRLSRTDASTAAPDAGTRTSEEQAKRRAELAPPRRLLSNRAGTIDLAVQSDTPLVWLYILSGRSLLARVPYVPGCVPDVALELPDDTARLGVEGELAQMQGELIETIARSAVYKALARKFAEETPADFTKVQKYVDRYKKLHKEQGLKVFTTKLEQIEFKRAKDATAVGNRVGAGRIRRLCNETRDVLKRHFDELKELQFLTEMETAIKTARKKAATKKSGGG